MTRRLFLPLTGPALDEAVAQGSARLAGGAALVVVVPPDVPVDGQLQVLEALARLALAARRSSGTLTVDAPPGLRALAALAGLSSALGLPPTL